MFKDLCGHINQQFFNAEGRSVGLACTLPKGHTGNHEATYTLKGEPAIGSWTDGAGNYPPVASYSKKAKKNEAPVDPSDATPA